MKKLPIDFDDIQKAMEDTERDAFDYYLDLETGEIIILSEDIINKAEAILDELSDEDFAEYEDVELDEEIDVPDWAEDEVELALDIFLYDKERYIRIPERFQRNTFSAMKTFAKGLEDGGLKEQLLAILDGKGAFRRFKDALGPHAKERKQWYGFNAKESKKEISDWLHSLGIEPRMDS